MKILILSSIDAEAVQRLCRDHDVVSAVGLGDAEIRELVRDREALVFRSGVAVTADLMRAAPDLKLLVRAGSGCDNIDLGHVTTRGLELARIPEPGARAVAELTFGMMLTLARKIHWADRMWRQGHWVKQQSSGQLLQGKVLGIVGAGSIGTEVGALGAAWGMDAVGCVAHPSDAVAARLEARGIRLAGFDEVVETSHFLSVHVPLTATTRGLIGDDVLSRMRPGSFLLSTARGGVVDEAALRLHLLAGDRLLGAGLDVHAAEGDGHVSPLADLPNVLLTPHIGSMTVDTQREIGERIVAIIDGFAQRSSAAAPTPTVA